MTDARRCGTCDHWREPVTTRQRRCGMNADIVTFARDGEQCPVWRECEPVATQSEDGYGK